MTKRAVSFRFPNRELRDMNRVARDRNVTRTEVIRDAWRHYRAAADSEAPLPKRPTRDEREQ
jgi:hypothetical protein